MQSDFIIYLVVTHELIPQDQRGYFHLVANGCGEPWNYKIFLAFVCSPRKPFTALGEHSAGSLTFACIRRTQ